MADIRVANIQFGEGDGVGRTAVITFAYTGALTSLPCVQDFTVEVLARDANDPNQTVEDATDALHRAFTLLAQATARA